MIILIIDQVLNNVFKKLTEQNISAGGLQADPSRLTLTFEFLMNNNNDDIVVSNNDNGMLTFGFNKRKVTNTTSTMSLQTNLGSPRGLRTNNSTIFVSNSNVDGSYLGSPLTNSTNNFTTDPSKSFILEIPTPTRGKFNN